MKLLWDLSWSPVEKVAEENRDMMLISSGRVFKLSQFHPAWKLIVRVVVERVAGGGRMGAGEGDIASGGDGGSGEGGTGGGKELGGIEGAGALVGGGGGCGTGGDGGGKGLGGVDGGLGGWREKQPTWLRLKGLEGLFAPQTASGSTPKLFCTSRIACSSLYPHDPTSVMTAHP